MAKENSIKMKREPAIWDNIFDNDTSDQSLISKIHKQHTRLHSRKTKQNKTKQTNKKQLKIGKRLEQTLLQGGHTEGPETYERILSITSHQREAN